MASAIELSGDISAAATALAGLLLVFIGAIFTAFDSYEKQEQGTVRSRYQRRAWFAFFGFVLSIFATALALTGKWLQQERATIVAIACLAIALICTLIAAFFSVREIK
jgi:putative Mn2+ efflux pump MntP